MACIELGYPNNVILVFVLYRIQQELARRHECNLFKNNLEL